MPIHNTYTLENADGATFRADLNTYIAALVSNSSSLTEPPNPKAGMFWVDLGSLPVYLKLRDSTNNLWINIYDITNDRGIIAASADDADTINFVPPSATDDDPTTIVRTRADSLLSNNIVANDCTGFTNRVGGLSLANVLDITGQDHKEIVAVAGNFIFEEIFASNDQAVSISPHIQIAYTVRCTGTIRLYHHSNYYQPSHPERDYTIYKNTTLVDGPYAAEIQVANNDVRSIARTIDIPVIPGDKISMRMDIDAAPTQGGVYSFQMWFCWDNYGWRFLREVGT